MKNNTQRVLERFLKTLKVHNKDLTTCFGDALAERHILSLHKQELEKVREESFNEGYIKSLKWCKEVGVKDPMIQGKLDLLKREGIGYASGILYCLEKLKDEKKVYVKVIDRRLKERKV